MRNAGSMSTLTGIGTGMVMLTALMVTGDYFNRHKAVALGIAAAGSGVGQLVIPYVLRGLFDSMGFSGALLLYGKC